LGDISIVRDEQKGIVMEQDDQDFITQAADVVGESVEKAASLLIDEMEDLSLWFMEKAAQAYPENPNLGQVNQILNSLRKVTPHVPQLAGHLVASSIFIGLSLGRETVRITKKLLDE
jgi:hypothetical protein